MSNQMTWMYHIYRFQTRTIKYPFSYHLDIKAGKGSNLFTKIFLDYLFRLTFIYFMAFNLLSLIIAYYDQANNYAIPNIIFIFILVSISIEQCLSCTWMFTLFMDWINTGFANEIPGDLRQNSIYYPKD